MSEYSFQVGTRSRVAVLCGALTVSGCGQTTSNDTSTSGDDSAQPSDTSSSAGGMASGGAGGMASGGAGGATDPPAMGGTDGSSPSCALPSFASPEQVAARLERLLWDTDGSVTAEAVASGELVLTEPDDVRAHARTMLRDPRLGLVGLAEFVKSWLFLDESRLSMPDDLLASTRESTKRTLDTMLFNSGAPFHTVYNGDWAVIDALLADYYGVPAPDGEWGIVTLPEARRVGLLGQHFWLNANPDPARRGTVLSGALRCLPIPPIPLSEPVRENRSTELSRRDAYLASVADPACWNCHAFIAPLGLTFEHFDGYGEYRTTDNGFEVDSSGGIPGTDIEVDAAPELGAVFAGELQAETQHCAARHAVAYALGDPTYLPTSDFDDLACFESLNPDLALEAGTFSEWALELVGSPVFLAAYPE